MTIQEMKNIKNEFGISNEEIARKAGLPVSTLQRIFSGETKAPRQKTLQALERVLSAWPSARSAGVPEAASLRESAVPYELKKQGEYTVDDYYAIPDERRVELIDGVIYDMSAPSLLHQKILGQLYLQFQVCADAHGDGCEVYLSPCDVQLDMDNRTMLQPDLFLVCRDYDRKARAFFGAPDLAVEILSPSTRSKDMLLKLNKYYHAGVREYWIIDPEHREIFVYDFTVPDFRPETFSFDDRIPVHLSKGACEIDFAKIHQKIAAHY